MKNQTGFTLLELLTVVAILAILAAIALPSYQTYVERTDLAVAKNELLDIAAQMRQNKMLNNGNYSTAGLASLINAKNNNPQSKYTFISGFGSGSSINSYYVYLQPRPSSYRKSLYITASGTIYECKTVSEAQSKSSSCTMINK